MSTVSFGFDSVRSNPNQLLCLLIITMLLGAGPSHSVAQASDAGALIVEEPQPNYPPREPRVLRETLSAEEIDRAVLNRLLGEISRDPEATKARLALNESQLTEISITLSNARGFINGSEMANVRAMCSAWNDSIKTEEARVEEALEAYRSREQLTRRFIAKYYSVVLYDIESLLGETSKTLLDAYMRDRRRRMANAGATSLGSPVQNIRAGTDTIAFHCR